MEKSILSRGELWGLCRGAKVGVGEKGKERLGGGQTVWVRQRGKVGSRGGGKLGWGEGDKTGGGGRGEGVGVLRGDGKGMLGRERRWG